MALAVTKRLTENFSLSDGVLHNCPCICVIEVMLPNIFSTSLFQYSLAKREASTSFC